MGGRCHPVGVTEGGYISLEDRIGGEGGLGGEEGREDPFFALPFWHTLDFSCRQLPWGRVMIGIMQMNRRTALALIAAGVVSPVWKLPPKPMKGWTAVAECQTFTPWGGYREKLLYLYPDAPPVLSAITSRLKPGNQTTVFEYRGNE